MTAIPTNDTIEVIFADYDNCAITMLEAMDRCETLIAQHSHKAVEEAREAGALAAQSVLNQEMGIDSHASAQYLLKRAEELNGGAE